MRITILVAVALLGACGGGGGEQTTPPVRTPVNIAGIYQGIVTTDRSGQLEAFGIADAAGNLRVIYEDGQSLQVNITQTPYSKNTGYFYASGAALPGHVTMAGTATARSEVTGAYTVPQTSTDPADGGDVSLFFDAQNFDAARTLDFLVGTWAGAETSLTFDQAGGLSGVEGGCTYDGAATNAVTGKNVFRLDLNRRCGPTPQGLTGLATTVVDNGTDTLVLHMSGGGQAYIRRLARL